MESKIMSRTTLEPQISNTTKKEECPKHLRLISSSNDKLQIAPGFSLAIIDENGRIIRQGNSVSDDVFNAMKTQVIERFCSRFSAFTETDFKEHE
jgi:hypothetical protein